MGGKSYYCDYCCCYMKNNKNVRRKHNEGLAHTVAKTTYMRRFEDPRTILKNEIAKVPCTRFWKGFCKFELFCQYGHYSTKQLNTLQKLVTHCKGKGNKPRVRVYNIATTIWKSSPQRKLQPKLPKKLPPSLRAIDFNRINDTCLNTVW